MAILSNGIETIEAGSKVWRIICNNNFSILNDLIDNVDDKADKDLSNVSDIDFKTKADNINVAYQSDLDDKANIDLSNLANTQVSEDIVYTDETKGLVLVDRSDTSKKYRLYVDNGEIKIELV